ALTQCRRHGQEEDQDGQGPEEDTHLGTGQEAQRQRAPHGTSVALLGAGGRRWGHRRLSLLRHAHHRVPFAAKPSMTSTVDSSTKAGPVSTGCSPPPL